MDTSVTKIHRLLLIKLQMLRNNILSLRKHSKLKLLFVTGFTIGLALAIFYGFYDAFRYVYHFPGFGLFLMDRLVYLFYFALMIMMIFSSGITSYMTLFRSKVNDHLMSLPCSYRTIFFVRFWDTCFFSSWASLYLVIPMIVAYGLVRSVPWTFYIVSLLATIPFLLLASALGCLCVLVILCVFSLKRLQLVLIGGLVTAVCIGYIASRVMLKDTTIDQLELQILNRVLKHTAFVQHPLLPSAWMSRCVLALIGGHGKDLFFYFCLLGVNAVFFFYVNLMLGGNFYYHLWQGIGTLSGKKRFHRGLYQFCERLLSFLPRPYTHLIIKDIKLFFRDPMQWGQFLVFFGLLGVYFMNLRNMPYDIDDVFWKIIILILNLISTSLVLATLTTRFIFPLFSLEGKRYWIVGMVPMRINGIIFEKFLLSFFSILLITECLTILSNTMLKASATIMGIACLTILMVCFALSGLSVGLGVLFPNFQDENPAKIVSGFGGTLLLIMSLIYIIVIVSLVMGPVYAYHVKATILARAYFWWMVGALLLGATISAVIGAAPMMLGVRRLKNMEY